MTYIQREYIILLVLYYICTQISHWRTYRTIICVILCPQWMNIIIYSTYVIYTHIYIYDNVNACSRYCGWRRWSNKMWFHPPGNNIILFIIVNRSRSACTERGKYTYRYFYIKIAFYRKEIKIIKTQSLFRKNLKKIRKRPMFTGSVKCYYTYLYTSIIPDIIWLLCKSDKTIFMLALCVQKTIKNEKKYDGIRVLLYFMFTCRPNS